MPASDTLLAATAFAAVVVELAIASPPRSFGAGVAAVAFAAALAAPIALRRERPAEAAVVCALVLAAAAAATTVGDLLTPFVILLVAVYTLAARTDGRRLWVASALTLAALVAAAGLASGEVVANVIWAVGIICAPGFLIGREVRRRAEAARLLSERARSLEAEREQRAHAAALEERGRIAGELHDVIAHGVSSMVVQAGAARRLAAVDPDRAREAIVAIEETGRDALGEMRRLLGVLRRGDEDLALAPQPSLSRLRALVAEAHEAGVDVVVRIEGDAVTLPAGVDVAAYRVLEDALRAAGGAQAEVVVRWRRRELELEVAGDGRGPDDERDALVALRERVALFGGEIQSGRRRGGGYGVRARLPLAAETA
jgi:signal transduction histidine kinase